MADTLWLLYTILNFISIALKVLLILVPIFAVCKAHLVHVRSQQDQSCSIRIKYTPTPHHPKRYSRGLLV